jgi:hypothetical protein
MGRGKGDRCKISDQEKQRIISLAKEGKTLPEIVKITGWSYPTVYRVGCYFSSGVYKTWVELKGQYFNVSQHENWII